MTQCGAATIRPLSAPLDSRFRNRCKSDSAVGDLADKPSAILFGGFGRDAFSARHDKDFALPVQARSFDSSNSFSPNLVSPNSSEFSDLLLANGTWPRALAQFENAIASGAMPSPLAFDHALKVCAREGQWRRALRLLSTMKQMGIPHSPSSFSAAVASCERFGQGEKALQLLEVTIYLPSLYHILSFPCFF